MRRKNSASFFLVSVHVALLIHFFFFFAAFLTVLFLKFFSLFYVVYVELCLCVSK